jgi:hypothetical protein
MIYTGEIPDLELGENGIVKRRPAIRLRAQNGQALRQASRVNFLKLYTVEHNIPVAHMGEISHEDVSRLRRYCGLNSTASSLTSMDEE